MGDVVSLLDFMQGRIDAEMDEEIWSSAELICLHCKHRYFAAFALEHNYMKDWECPECERVGGVMQTGQFMDDVDEGSVTDE